MGTVTGYWGKDNYTHKLTGPTSLNVTLPANTYPSGQLVLNSISSGSSPACWNRTGTSQTKHIDLYLCDSAGNNRVSLGGFNLSSATSKAYHTFNVGSGAQALAGKALYIVATGDTDNIESYHKITFTLGTTTLNYTISASSGAGGTLKASHSSAQPGTVITLTPTASTGYKFKNYTTTGGITISNNKFTMPAANVTIVANFEKITYTITRKSSPAAAGTVTTNVATATMGTTVTVGHIDNTGYEFQGYSTSPAGLISGSSFTMPASNVTITGSWKRRSTGALNKTTLTGGENVKLTVNAESSSYTHRFRISFGSGMDSGWISMAAGVTSATYRIPDEWSNQVTNATSKTGGTLTLQTYSGGSQVAENYVISGLVYAVPASEVPDITELTAAVAHTVGSKTYHNPGDGIYTQNHAGVTVTATAEGMSGATISSMTVKIGGKSGSDYNKTVSGGSLSFTSGLLTTSGSVSIKVTATDSRGRTNTQTRTITVTKYNQPTGELSVKRVDSQGQDDPTGEYGKYELTRTYTPIGSGAQANGWAVNRLEIVNGDFADNPPASGDLLPGNRESFNVLREYKIKLTLTDKFGETAEIIEKLPSGKYAIFVGKYGDQIAFMKAVTKSIPEDKTSTLEIPGECQVYIGDDKLEKWTKDLAGEAADERYGLYTNVGISTTGTITVTVPGLTAYHVVDGVDFFASSALSNPTEKIMADFKWQTTANTLTLTVDKVYASCWVRFHFANRLT